MRNTANYFELARSDAAPLPNAPPLFAWSYDPAACVDWLIPVTNLTPEEQMAWFETELKSSDSGHQPS